MIFGQVVAKHPSDGILQKSIFYGKLVLFQGLVFSVYLKDALLFQGLDALFLLV